MILWLLKSPFMKSIIFYILPLYRKQEAYFNHLILEDTLSWRLLWEVLSYGTHAVDHSSLCKSWSSSQEWLDSSKIRFYNFFCLRYRRKVAHCQKAGTSKFHSRHLVLCLAYTFLYEYVSSVCLVVLKFWVLLFLLTIRPYIYII